MAPRTTAQQSVIIAAASARALAASAVLAGYHVLCTDCFGDADLRLLLSRDGGEFLGPLTGFSDLPQILNSVPADIPLLWAGGLENHLPLLTEIARSRPLLGLPLNVVRRLRQPQQLASLFAPSQSPHVQFPESVFGSLPGPGRWLWKPTETSGGLGVQRLSDDLRRQLASAPALSAGCFQRAVDGLPCSTLVATDSNGVEIIGLSLQFSGWPELNAAGFRFCGNLGPLTMPPRLAAALGSAMQRLQDVFEIPRGIFGVDLMLTTSHCWLLEVNPRIPASHWIYETPEHWNAVHFAAGGPRSADHSSVRPPLRIQLILWSHSPLTFPEPEEISLPAGSCLRLADCPASKTQVPAGTPVCSVLAEQLPEARPEDISVAISRFPERLARQLQFRPAAVAAAIRRQLQSWELLAETWK